MSHLRDEEQIKKTRNTARFFVENRHISWMLFFAVILWGIYGYLEMPKRKDPNIPGRVAVVLCPWPGAGAEKIEQLIARRIEEKIAENPKIKRIYTTARTGMAVMYLELLDDFKEAAKEFDDIKLRLDGIRDLPENAGPIFFLKDYSDTAALMLTVSSPKADDTELAIRADAVRKAVDSARSSAARPSSRATLLVCFPFTIPPETLLPPFRILIRAIEKDAVLKNTKIIRGAGFLGLDGETDLDDGAINAYIARFMKERLHEAEFHPDIWDVGVVRNSRDVAAVLRKTAGDKYSYRQLDDMTDLIVRTLKTVPDVAKVDRVGVQQEQIFLEYSQERLAAYGIKPTMIRDILGARNITGQGGVVEISGRNISIDSSGEFKNEGEIGNVLLTASTSGAPLYLRDLMTITRSYENPVRFLNFYTSKDAAGNWYRSRAVTLAVQMREGHQIAEFGLHVDEALAGIAGNLPADLILARTSDQPLQVKESIDLFMKSLYEAIALVVLMAFIGFWEWRSAALLSLSIPLTMAMTFGMMHLLGIDMQQVSIASLIIALGLLVDDPVVAGDAIKRDLNMGHPPAVSSWLGPTKLATVIMYATITNIVAYLPFLLLKGDSGTFIYSLPIVLTCSLVSSRIVSMTFIPFLAYYLLRPDKEKPLAPEERRTRGFPGFYFRLGTAAIRHRWKVLTASLIFLACGVFFMVSLKMQYFPNDLSYLSYVDIWLPENASLSSTYEATGQAEKIIRRVAEQYGKDHPDDAGKPRQILNSLTTFVGGGGPRFWFSINPEMEQLNYAQIVILVKDKHDTSPLLGPLQTALADTVPGARIDVRPLETGAMVGIPVQVRVSGNDIATLRRLADEIRDVFRKMPEASGVRDDWGAESLKVKYRIDSDRANLARVSNADIAFSSATAVSGFPVASLREGHRQIPVVMRLRMDERGQLSDLSNLYISSSQEKFKVPLRQVADIDYDMEAEKIRRRDQFRTITVSCFPAEGYLASEVMDRARSELAKIGKQMPLGYKMEIGGEEEEQGKGFKELAIVLVTCVFSIFLALVFQFRNAVKPLLVFAAIPFGMVGAYGGLYFMNLPFGFMAFLGIISLVGVIVSHIIVLFDFIEEMREKGEPLEEALLDAGIVRLRPVLVTVGATVFGLVPLALHGGPLWEPLCYAQIGGLSLATFITLILVPVIYAIAVLDLKIIKWEA
ncbi:MAG TPA: efflux RND transporter permease subunit [Syntrophales bacterium]|nr:efflux RND transporter permease subunit [Syntrophales bacterium]